MKQGLTLPGLAARVQSEQERKRDLSAWGYLNAVTRAAQDCDDYERATDLERLGGQILAEPALVLA